MALNHKRAGVESEAAGPGRTVEGRAHRIIALVVATKRRAFGGFHFGARKIWQTTCAQGWRLRTVVGLASRPFALVRPADIPTSGFGGQLA